MDGVGLECRECFLVDVEVNVWGVGMDGGWLELWCYIVYFRYFCMFGVVFNFW